jgi:hypothetical protein
MSDDDYFEGPEPTDLGAYRAKKEDRKKSEDAISKMNEKLNWFSGKLSQEPSDFLGSVIKLSEYAHSLDCPDPKTRETLLRFGPGQALTIFGNKYAKASVDERYSMLEQVLEFLHENYDHFELHRIARGIGNNVLLADLIASSPIEFDLLPTGKMVEDVNDFGGLIAKMNALGSFWACCSIPKAEKFPHILLTRLGREYPELVAELQKTLAAKINTDVLLDTYTGWDAPYEEILAQHMEWSCPPLWFDTVAEEVEKKDWIVIDRFFMDSVRRTTFCDLSVGGLTEFKMMPRYTGINTIDKLLDRILGGTS